MTYPPDLDAVGGRSYKQSSQTAGALSGRRDVVQWYSEGTAVNRLLAGFWERTSTRWAVWDKNTGTWSGEELTSGYGPADNQVGVRALTSALWFLFTWRARETYDGRTKWTKDGGATWDALALPDTDYDWQDIDIAPDGRLWGLTQLDRRPLIQRDSKIWYSDTGGDSWVESHFSSLNYQEIVHIATHPTDPDIIAAWGVRSGDIVVYVTQNRGGSWTQNIASSRNGAVRGHETGMIMLDDGRMCCCNFENGTVKAGFQVSDNFGASWTFKKLFGTRGAGHYAFSPVRNASGSRIFFLWIDGDNNERRVMESNDRGETWTIFDSEVPFDYFSGPGFGGLAYDRNDTLWVGNNNSLTNGLEAIMRMTPIAAVGGSWTDESGNIKDLDPDAFRFVDGGRGQKIMWIPT